jgi:hypothetical protein
MRVYRFIAPTIFLTLLSLAGCNSQPAPTPAPVAAPPAPVVHANGEVHVRLENMNPKKWETHHYVAQGDMAIWKATSGFKVAFEADADPCVATPGVRGAVDVYPSAPPSGGSSKHVAKCTILTKSAGAYPYQVDAYDDSTPRQPPAIRIRHVTPCSGCNLEVGGDN